jgi:hypothetical protein
MYCKNFVNVNLVEQFQTVKGTLPHHKLKEQLNGSEIQYLGSQ